MTRCNTNSWRYVDSQYIFYHWGSTYFSLFFRTFAFAKPFKISGDTFLEWRLLIVPFGIETSFADLIPFLRMPFNRTIWNWNDWCVYAVQSGSILLIVPFGIETLDRGTLAAFSDYLLIVPFGIETLIWFAAPLFPYTFNRTIWNWN